MFKIHELIQAKRAAILGLILFVGVALAWMYYPAFLLPEPRLTFKIEGFLESKINFRDAGSSINQCADEALLPESQIMRASGFFSGWSCEKVGHPDVIYSLNYSDAEGKRYYCRGAEGQPHGLLVGMYYQTIEMSDIEFLSNWSNNSEQVRSVCQFLDDGIKQIRKGKKILLHCDAGRDRTGAVIALLAAYEIEARGALSDQAIQAIECDYRKSKSLKPAKYGRIQKLLEELRASGGVRQFIRNQCGSFVSDI
jgi:hypothetical protein